jgi:hypothetical protein
MDATRLRAQLRVLGPVGDRHVAVVHVADAARRQQHAGVGADLEEVECGDPGGEDDEEAPWAGRLEHDEEQRQRYDDRGHDGAHDRAAAALVRADVGGAG